jgi:hypothetical protein
LEISFSKKIIESTTKNYKNLATVKFLLHAKLYINLKKKRKEKKTCPTMEESLKKKVTIGHQNQLSNNIL